MSEMVQADMRNEHNRGASDLLRNTPATKLQSSKAKIQCLTKGRQTYLPCLRRSEMLIVHERSVVWLDSKLSRSQQGLRHGCPLLQWAWA